ncbi:hypothetical protein [Clavibacter michiganensis]|uniref:hypothetical protein n=1 Tax=Clavibacter michiganensis TaxID=28447 RepID=UPI0015E23607|nr:hypothetical protein [Clavibacter michiganensis]
MLELLNECMPGERSFRHTGILDRTALTVTYRVNEAEQEARVARGVESVEDEFLLSALMTMPTDSLGAVDPRFARVLHTARAACVATVLDDPEGGTWAQRRLGVPLEVAEIEIATDNWARGITAAHKWVGYAPRWVRLQGAVSAIVLTEAAHYGVGVVTADGDRLVEPAAYRPERWSSARWRLAELIYGQFRTLST